MNAERTLLTIIPSIFMLEKVVTSFNTNNLKARTLQRSRNFFACEARQFRHAAMVTF